MRHEIKFPTECFSDMHDNTPLRYRIAEHVKIHGIEERQPNLFSRMTWEKIFAINEDMNPRAVTGASLITAWGFAKRSYQCNPVLIDQLITSDICEIDMLTDSVFDLKSCCYFEGSGNWMNSLDVQGYWMSIQNNGDGSGSVLWLLNTATAMIPIEFPFDESGMSHALSEYKESAEEFGTNVLGMDGSGHAETGSYLIGSIMCELKLLFYVLSTNAEIRQICSMRNEGYQLGESGVLTIPGKMAQFIVGESIGSKMNATDTMKNARWVVNEDKSFSWLCGDDSLGFDYRDAEYDPMLETDEELVAANEGCLEYDFSAILTEEESVACDNGLSDEELRVLIIERVHQARSRVAQKNGTIYDREVTTSEVKGEDQEGGRKSLSALAKRTMAASERSRLAYEKRATQTGNIAPFIYSIFKRVRRSKKSNLINS